MSEETVPDGVQTGPDSVALWTGFDCHYADSAAPSPFPPFPVDESYSGRYLINKAGLLDAKSLLSHCSNSQFVKPATVINRHSLFRTKGYVEPSGVHIEIMHSGVNGKSVMPSTVPTCSGDAVVRESCTVVLSLMLVTLVCNDISNDH